MAENRILRDQVNGRLLLSDSEKKTLAEIGYRLGRKALEDVANAAKPETILGWYSVTQVTSFARSRQLDDLVQDNTNLCEHYMGDSLGGMR